jgi:endonuclease YncB( thermonuclease family)
MTPATRLTPPPYQDPPMLRQLVHDLLTATWRLLAPPLRDYDVPLTAMLVAGALSLALALVSAVAGYRLGARRTAARLAPPPDPLPDGTRVKVERVIDGDTFVASLPSGHELKVRVLGLDTPESKRNAKARRDADRESTSVTTQITLGSAAHDAATKLLSGKRVRLEAAKPDTPLRTDKYGRTLAYVRMRNGRDFGEEIIRKGFGECYGWAISHPREARYARARPSTGRLQRIRDRVVSRAKKKKEQKGSKGKKK